MLFSTWWERRSKGVELCCIGCEPQRFHSVMPQLKINVGLRMTWLNDDKALTIEQMTECLRKAGIHQYQSWRRQLEPGLDYPLEMGGIQNGKKTPSSSSIANHQLHAVADAPTWRMEQRMTSTSYPKIHQLLYGFCQRERAHSCGWRKARNEG